jgi:energy-coupling factor transport system ATP-binding protein
MDRLVRLTQANVRLLCAQDGLPLLTIDRLVFDGGLLYGLAGPNLSGRSAFLRYTGGGFLVRSINSELGNCTVELSLHAQPERLDPSLHSVYLGPNPFDSLSSLTTTVIEEIELHRSLCSADSLCTSEDEYNLLIKSFHLQDILGQNPITLSGGQAAALAIVCALLMKRPIICVDEIFAHLDVELRPKAWEYCRSYAKTGGMVFVADNHLDLMAEWADRIILMNDGRIDAIDTPKIVFNRHELIHRKTIPTPTRLASTMLPGIQELPTLYGELCRILETKLQRVHIRSENPMLKELNDSTIVIADSSDCSLEQSPYNIEHLGGSYLSFDNLLFGYPGSRGRAALNRASAILPGASSIALIGANGAGKSTLCKILNGLLTPQQGVVRLSSGDIVPSRQPGQYVSLAFQNPDDELFLQNVVDELEYGPRNLQMTSHDIEAAVQWVLEAFDLGAVAKAHPLDLPFTLRKRISMAAAVAMQRPWTVLDEPTLGQDSSYCDKLLAIKDRITHTGGGLIIISHDPEFIFEACDYFVLMDAGRIVWYGPRSEYLAVCGRDAQAFINMPGRFVRDLSLPSNCSTRSTLARYFLHC